MASRPSERYNPVLLELMTGFIALLAASLMLWLCLEASPVVPLAAMVTFLVLAGLILHFIPDRSRWLGWANRITLVRGILIAMLAGALADPSFLASHALPLVSLATLALLLDGVDGWIARRTRTASLFGAHFDMELDTFFILVLCLALIVLDKVGLWVVLIGTIRYAFVMAGLRLTWLQHPLPPSQRRKAICVWQVAALMLGLLPMIDTIVAAWLAATALAGLVGSFGRDVGWLYRHRVRPRKDLPACRDRTRPR